MARKLITKREIRAFTVSALIPIAFAITNSASAYWTDSNITVATVGSDGNAAAITSATYVPPPILGACTPPKDKGQNFQVLVNPPAGYNIRRNPSTDPPMGQAGTDGYRIDLTRSSGIGPFTGSAAAATSGTPAATLNTTTSPGGGTIVQGADSSWFSAPGLVWGFGPPPTPSGLLNGAGSINDISAGVLSVSTQIGAWYSNPISLNYNLNLTITYNASLLFIGGGNTVTFNSSSCGPATATSSAPIATFTIAEPPSELAIDEPQGAIQQSPVADATEPEPTPDRAMLEPGDDSVDVSTPSIE